jgi:16S rRNA (guanine(966)-N(2))-methyltransferase RsmD
VKRFLKLTGGSFMGRRLYVPDMGVRPATNLVREAIFSTLNSFFENGVQGLRVLDLFAGTGSLGLEAISRGAAVVTFVDQSSESVRSIRRNLEILEYEGQVIRSDVLQFLRRNRGLQFSLVFIDPPYRYEKTAAVVGELQRALVSEEKTLLVHERAYNRELPDFGDRALYLKRKKYGQTEILYFNMQE